MKGYMLLAFTFTIAQAVAYGLTRVPVNYIRQANVGPRTPLYTGQRYYGLSGRPEFTETYQQESGNLYDGQREGRFYTRDSIDNPRGVQYSSLRPGTEYTRTQFGTPYNNQQQFRSQEGGYRTDGGFGRQQITYRAPLANTRSYNPQFDVVGNY